LETGSICEPAAAALCHIARFVVLGATLVTGRPSAFQLRASNGQILAQSKSAEVTKISEYFSLFFENVNECLILGPRRRASSLSIEAKNHDPEAR